MNILPCDEAALDAASNVLLSGGVAVIPTDTVYGLAAHPDFPAAVERLYTIKGRAAKKPIALLVADADSAKRFLGGVFPPGADALAARHWPGALTLVLPKGGEYEGLRVPAHEWTRRLLSRCGGVLRVTSANLSGGHPATDVPAALADVGLSADIVLDGGVSPGGIPSTVVRVDAVGAVTLLREGGVRI